MLNSKLSTNPDIERTHPGQDTINNLCINRWSVCSDHDLGILRLTTILGNTILKGLYQPLKEIGLADVLYTKKISTIKFIIPEHNWK